MIRDRAEAAGLGKVHPHQLRRYGASLAAERAREAHRRLALGGQL